MANATSMSDVALAEEANPCSPASFSAASQNLLNSSMHKIAPAVARAQSDQRIRELEAEIRAIKTFRNASADTSVLPAEIISKIFMILASTSHDARRVSWLGVTHVCRHWRAVALACPSLWSYLTFHCKPALTELMLSRSKSAPLSIKYSCGVQAASAEIFRQVILQPDRLRSIEFITNNGRFADQPNFFQSDFSKATLLEAFTFRGSDTTYGYGPSSLIPKDFLQPFERFSSLTHLEITGCSLSWDSIPAAVRMTYLKLHNSSESRPLPHLFLQSLASMPRLQYLDISGFLPRNPGNSGLSPPTTRQPISLPALQRLKLQDPINDIIDLFEVIQIPRTASIGVKCSGIVEEAQQVSAFFVALKDIWIQSTDGAQPHLQELRFKNFVSGGTAEVLCWFGERPPPVREDDEETAALVVAFKGLRIPGQTVAFNSVCEQLDLTPLRSLRIQTSSDLQTGDWTKPFRSLKNLETVTIWGSSITAFISVLEEDPVISRCQMSVMKEGSTKAKGSKKRRAKTKGSKASASTERTRMYFPALRTLRFYNVDFDERMTEDLQIAMELADLLHKRARLSAVETLKIERCTNFSADHSYILEDIVPDFVWDGYEDIEYDSVDYDEEDYGFDEEDYDSDWDLNYF